MQFVWVGYPPANDFRDAWMARLVQLAGTRAGGFVLTRQEGAGKWGFDTYSLVRHRGP